MQCIATQRFLKLENLNITLDQAEDLLSHVKLFVVNIVLIIFLKNRKTFHSKPLSLVFPRKFSNLVLLSRLFQDCEGGSGISESLNGHKEKTPRDCCRKSHLLYQWVGCASGPRNLGTSYMPAKNSEEISVCLVLFICPGGSCPLSPPLALPFSLSLW